MQNLKPYKPSASVTLKAVAHCINLLSIHNFLLCIGHLENIGSLLYKPSKCHHIPLYTIKKISSEVLKVLGSRHFYQQQQILSVAFLDLTAHF